MFGIGAVCILEASHLSLPKAQMKMISPTVSSNNKESSDGPQLFKHCIVLQ